MKKTRQPVQPLGMGSRAYRPTVGAAPPPIHSSVNRAAVVMSLLGNVGKPVSRPFWRIYIFHDPFRADRTTNPVKQATEAGKAFGLVLVQRNLANHLTMLDLEVTMSNNWGDDWSEHMAMGLYRLILRTIGTIIALLILVFTLGLGRRKRVAHPRSKWKHRLFSVFLLVIGYVAWWNLSFLGPNGGLLGGGIFLATIIGVVQRHRGGRHNAQSYGRRRVVEAKVYLIYVPKTTEVNHTTALHFIEHLLHAYSALMLQITADAQGVKWRVVDVMGVDATILAQFVRSLYPNAEVRQRLEPLPDEEFAPFYRYVAYYQQPNEFIAPILHLSDFKNVTPLASLAHVLSDLREGERVEFCVAVNGIALDKYAEGQHLITRSTIHPLQFLTRRGIGDAVQKALTHQERMEKYQPSDMRVFEDKLSQRLFYAHVLVQVDTPNPTRVHPLLTLVDTQLSHFTRMPYNAVQWVERRLDRHTVIVSDYAQDDATSSVELWRHWLKTGRPKAPSLVLEQRELAALWHLPTQVFTATRIAWGRGLISVPEAVARVGDGIDLGTGWYQGRDIDVKLPIADRVTHLHILGKTGTGKSTLLHSLIHQDIQRGAGVAVIDPHGTLVRQLLQTSIPKAREREVVVIDLSDREYPPPLNPLRGVNTYRGVLQVVGVIERLFAGTDQTVRVANYLRAALLPLYTDTHATMRDLGRIFMDETYRDTLVSRIEDPETQDFWDYQYSLLSRAMQRQLAEPILNRVRPFYANPHLYPVLCHPEMLDFGRFIRENKIILVSLAMDDDHVPEQERNLVGSLLISRLQMAGMKEPRSEPFYLYIDEVQKFVTTSLPVLYSEARKYGLSLTTASQFLGQLEGKTLEAVMGNVGTTIAFACSPDDAKAVATYMRPGFDAQGLLNLDRFQAAVKLQVQAQTQPAFSLITPPPMTTSLLGTTRETQLRDLSRQQYMPHNREKVMTWLNKRYPRRRPAEVKISSEAETFYE